MQEFASVSVSSTNPSALTAELDAKSAEGWSVVAIVPTAGDVTAYLCREAGEVPASEVTEPVADVTPEPAVTPEPVVAAVAEPAGWAVAPEPAPAAEPIAPVEPTPSAQPVAAQTSYQQATPAAQASPAADWYADPAGRFDLRYWDGTKWTEHVSRAGQQFTDPPFA